MVNALDTVMSAMLAGEQMRTLMITTTEYKLFEDHICNHSLKARLERHYEPNLGDLCKRRRGAYGGCPLGCHPMASEPYCVDSESRHKCDADIIIKKLARNRGFVLEKRGMFDMNTTIGVITTGITRDVPYLQSYFNSLLAQREINLDVIFGSDDTILNAKVAEVYRNISTHLSSPKISFRTIKTRSTALYDTWDEIITHLETPYLTTWNLDDTRFPWSTHQKLAVIVNSKVSVVDAVTCAVVAVTEDGKREIWWNNFDKQISQLRLAHLVAADTNRPNNIPHVGAVFKKDTYIEMGPFATRGDGESSILDWVKWVKWFQSGKRVLHINQALDIYTSRSTSYGHIAALKPKSDLFHSTMSTVRHLVVPLKYGTTKRKTVFVAAEMYPTNSEGGNVRLRQVVEWFASNAFTVIIFCRTMHYTRDGVHETLEWAKRIGVQLVNDNYSFDQMRFWDTSDVSVVLYSLWYWRYFTENVTSTVEMAFPNMHKIGVISIILSDDIHSERCLQIQACQPHITDIRNMERAAYTKGITLAISNLDQTSMQRLSPTSDIRFFPMIIDIKHLHTTNNKAREYLNDFLIYVGSNNDMNVIAVQRILQLNNQKMIFIGTNKWSRLIKRAGKHSSRCVPPPLSDLIPGEICKNSVQKLLSFDTIKDITPLLSHAKTMIALVATEGTGISTKVLIGLAHSMRVVTTQPGLYGTGCPSNHAMCNALHVTNLTSLNDAEMTRVVNLPPVVVKKGMYTRKLWNRALPEIFT